MSCSILQWHLGRMSAPLQSTRPCRAHPAFGQVEGQPRTLWLLTLACSKRPPGLQEPQFPRQASAALVPLYAQQSPPAECTWIICSYMFDRYHLVCYNNFGSQELGGTCCTGDWTDWTTPSNPTSGFNSDTTTAAASDMARMCWPSLRLSLFPDLGRCHSSA